jgi:hypothetical protein
MRYVGVTHGRQFTGGVFAGVSMRVRAVSDYLLISGQLDTARDEKSEGTAVMSLVHKSVVSRQNQMDN